MWRRNLLFDRLTLLRANNCCAVLTYNECITVELSRALNGKRVSAIPDVTDLEQPDFNYSIVQEIKRRARGRKIVGLFGNLCRDKGYVALLGAAQSLNRELYFFAMAGSLFMSPDDRNEWNLLHRHPALLQENVFMHSGRIPLESCYNALVASVDVQFMAYRSFPESSNNMAKAAHFRKPVIVSRGHLMEFRTRLYRLGAVITEENSEECARAIEDLTNPAWFTTMKPRFVDFVSAQSEEKARSLLKEILEDKEDKHDFHAQNS